MTNTQSAVKIHLYLIENITSRSRLNQTFDDTFSISPFHDLLRIVLLSLL